MQNKYPIIIPRAEHHISRRNLSPNGVRVLYRLKENGFLGYLVGGCVRDLLLGRQPKDFDIVTDATPGQIKKLFRNCRLVGRRFRLAHLHFNDEIIEVATFRAAGPDPADNLDTPENPTDRPPRHLKSEHGMVLRDNIFGTPEEDALRRDFTINALIYNVADFSLIDYAGGLADLQRRVIRTIGTPRERFIEDPVRMIRALRFAASLGFAIDAETWQALVELSPVITRAAPARLYEELLKLLLCGKGEVAWQLLESSGLLAALLPQLTAALAGERGKESADMISQGLKEADRLRLDKGGVSPQLLLVLLFGSILEREAAAAAQQGVTAQDALNHAVANLFEALAVTLRIPQKVVLLVRDIIAAQQRLRKMPGRNPAGFTARPSFADALLYLAYKGGTLAEAKAVAAWWEKYLTNSTVADSTPLAADEPRRRSRSRRRKKRGGQGPV